MKDIKFKLQIAGIVMLLVLIRLLPFILLGITLYVVFKAL
jgi:hypothetical protein